MPCTTPQKKVYHNVTKRSTGTEHMTSNNEEYHQNIMFTYRNWNYLIQWCIYHFRTYYITISVEIDILVINYCLGLDHEIVVSVVCLSMILCSHTSYGKISQMDFQCQKLGKIPTRPTYNLPSSFVVISNIYRSLIRKKSTFAKYCLTQWISKRTVSSQILQVRQCFVNLLGLVGIVTAYNTTVYKTEPIFTGCRYGKFS